MLSCFGRTSVLATRKIKSRRALIPIVGEMESGLFLVMYASGQTNHTSLSYLGGLSTARLERVCDAHKAACKTSLDQHSGLPRNHVAARKRKPRGRSSAQGRTKEKTAKSTQGCLATHCQNLQFSSPLLDFESLLHIPPPRASQGVGLLCNR